MARVRTRHRVRQASYSLQLTAMVDLFTILLVFLLKSYSTSSIQVSQIDDLRLPTSSAVSEPEEALLLVVSKKGIYIDDKQVVPMKDGNIEENYLDVSDRHFIRKLYEELDKEAKKSLEIAEKNDKHKFKGNLIVQADHNLNYAILKRVMYTSMLAGYADVKLGLMGFE